MSARDPLRSQAQVALPSAWAWRISLVLVSTALGYLAFRLFVGEVVPAPEAWALPSLAIAAAAATFFSPCSFPLLPAYLVHYLREASESGRGPLRLAAAASVGVLAFTLLLGVGIAAGGAGIAAGFGISTAQPAAATLWLRAVLGAALCALGGLALKGIAIPIPALHARQGALGLRVGAAGGAQRRLFAFGFLYNLAGIGCAGPILAGLVVFALAAGGPTPAFAAFLLYGATMSTFMMLTSATVALRRDAALESLRRNTRRVRTLAGAVQIAVGGFLLLSSLDPASFARLLFP